LTLRGHTDRVWSVAYSPDGRRLATGSEDGTVRLWDQETGRQVGLLRSPELHVHSLAFSPDGSRLAGVSFPHRVDSRPGLTVWSVATGKPSLSLPVGDHCTAFSPDGATLATLHNGSVVLLDAASGAQTAELTSPQYLTSFSLAFSPDGKQLAVGSRRKGPRLPPYSPAVLVWDLATREVRTTLTGHKDWYIEALAFSRDGRLLASGGWDGAVHLYETTTWTERHALRGHAGDVVSLAFSPDGRTLAAANYNWPDAGGPGQRVVKLWDTETGEERGMLRGHTRTLRAVAFNPNGKELASAGFDQTCKIWELAADPGVLPRPLGLGFDQTRKIWELAAVHDAQHLYDGAVPISALAADASGRFLAWGLDRSAILVYDLAARRLTGNRPPSFVAKRLALSPDGSCLAAANQVPWNVERPSEVRLFDPQTALTRLTMPGVGKGATVLAFSPDGQRLAVGGATDQPGKRAVPSLVIRDVTTGQELFAVKDLPDAPRCAAYSPDGQTLALGGDSGTVTFCDARTGQVTTSLPACEGSVWQLAFSPDGRRLATAHTNALKTPENSASHVRVWDIASRKEVLSLTGHTEMVSGLAFSPDGERLATASMDRTIKVWDARLGQEMLTLSGHASGVLAVLFSRDGCMLFSADTPAPNTRNDPKVYSVQLWDATPLPD
jgi:WD40 repeat protein